MSQKTVLVLDTSGPFLQLCLKIGDKNHLYSEHLPRGHAEVLFDRIAALLQQNYSKYSKITSIATTVGPGSFTGLRIGIAAARGLALALKIELIGVPNLFALSLALPKGPFHIILPARREQFYGQYFAGPARPKSEPQLLENHQVDLIRSDPANVIYSDAKIDMALVADFAAEADPKKFPPHPTYVRPADAKPQTKMPIARARTLKQG